MLCRSRDGRRIKASLKIARRSNVKNVCAQTLVRKRRSQSEDILKIQPHVIIQEMLKPIDATEAFSNNKAL